MGDIVPKHEWNALNVIVRKSLFSSLSVTICGVILASEAVF